MHICKECIQPDTRPGIFFDNEGVCGACIWEHEKKILDWKARELELNKIIENAKSKRSLYDCAIGVSGGKDSTYQTYMIKKEFGLNPLVVNFHPHDQTALTHILVIISLNF